MKLWFAAGKSTQGTSHIKAYLQEPTRRIGGELYGEKLFLVLPVEQAAEFLPPFIAKLTLEDEPVWAEMTLDFGYRTEDEK